MTSQARYDAAYTYLKECMLDPSPDAVEQLVEVFTPCLAIMCERGYEKDGSTWKEGGWRSQLVDIRKKFTRLWLHGWREGSFRPDHGLDMINYLGFYLRIRPLDGDGWGDWGEPGDDHHGKKGMK